MRCRSSTFNRFPAVTNVKNDFNGANAAEENEIRELSNCGKLLFHKLIFYSVFHLDRIKYTECIKSKITIRTILYYLSE